MKVQPPIDVVATVGAVPPRRRKRRAQGDRAGAPVGAGVEIELARCCQTASACRRRRPQDHRHPSCKRYPGHHHSAQSAQGAQAPTIGNDHQNGLPQLKASSGHWRPTFPSPTGNMFLDSRRLISYNPMVHSAQNILDDGHRLRFSASCCRKTTAYSPRVARYALAGVKGGLSCLIAVMLHYVWLASMRLITRAIAPTRMRLTAQAASRLNQLRATNLRPRWR